MVGFLVVSLRTKIRDVPEYFLFCFISLLVCWAQVDMEECSGLEDDHRLFVKKHSPSEHRQNLYNRQEQQVALIPAAGLPTPKLGFWCPRHGSQLGRLGSSSLGPCLVPTGCMRRACGDGLLQYRINVSPGFGVSFRNPTPVSPRSGQRGSAPSAQHGPEPGRRVPTGAARHERKPQCGEISHFHPQLECVFSLLAYVCLRRTPCRLELILHCSKASYTPFYWAPTNKAPLKMKRRPQRISLKYLTIQM